MDTVKSQMQTFAAGTRHAALSPIAVARSILTAHGVRGFYAGLGVTLLRAVPSNSCLFLVYDAVHRLLHKLNLVHRVEQSATA